MVVFYRVHARVLKTSTREDVIPGLVDCIRFVFLLFPKGILALIQLYSETRIM